MKKQNKIKIDYTRDSLLDDYAKSILRERYMLTSEKSPQDAFARAAHSFSGGDDKLAQRIYDYSSKLWFMFSTPILSNAGTERGLPISCYISEVQDSREGLNAHWNENFWLASNGGGIGCSYSNLRSNGIGTSKGSQSSGIIPFLHVTDSQMLAVSQGRTRRGSLAATLDITHPEIQEFIVQRKPTGGDPNRKNLNLHHGVNIPDKFMRLIEKCTKYKGIDDSWKLIDPHSKKTVKIVSAKALWELILETRKDTGEPFMHFIDTSNRLLSDVHKFCGRSIKTSNLCHEIILPTDEERTAVCCLSSVNLEYYDEWKDTQLVEDLVVFLDNVLEYFINNAPKEVMRNAIYSASRERSIGIGSMGFHAYLQKKGIPFESAMAVSINRGIYKNIREKAEYSTQLLAKPEGGRVTPPDYREYLLQCKYARKNEAPKVPMRRNINLIAIAPNATSSIICGNTSPSVEPYRANSFRQETLNGFNILKNKFLQKLLREKIPNEDERAIVWKSIGDNQGSVQHLDILTEDEKNVFKTAIEIDQNWIIEHASHRQNFIDQAQSINLFFTADVKGSYLHNVHFSAWKKGLKTLYYCRSEAASNPENIEKQVDKFEYNITLDNKDEEAYKGDENECLACEG